MIHSGGCQAVFTLMNILTWLFLSNGQVLSQLKEKALTRAKLTEDDILHSIEERAQARKNKDYTLSDQIRSDLAVKGIALMDLGKETVWRPCVPVQQANVVDPAQ